MSIPQEIQAARRSSGRWWTIMACLGIFTVVALVLAAFGVAVYVGNHPNRQLFAEIERYGGIESSDGSPPEWAEDSMLSSLFVTPTAVSFNSLELDDAKFDHLSRQLGSVTELSLSHTSVTDAGLAHLERFPNLETLTLAGPHFTGQGLQSLAKLRQLRHLKLYGIPASDDDFAPLQSCTHLASLSLHKVPVGQGLKHLVGGNLQELNITEAQITGSLAANLKATPLLTRAHIDGSNFNDDDVAQLMAGGSLQSLYVTDCSLTGACFKKSPPQPTLFSLGLIGTRLNDAGACALCRFQSLNDVDLERTAITDAALPHLGQLPELTYISLTETPISDAGLAHLCGLKNLRSLDLSFTNVRGAPLASLVGNEFLVQVDLTGACIDDLQLPVLALLELESISLSGTNVTPWGATWLQSQVPPETVHYDPTATRESLLQERREVEAFAEDE